MLTKFILCGRIYVSFEPDKLGGVNFDMTLTIQGGTSPKGPPGLLMQFNEIGVDFVGTLAHNNNINFPEPPYPVGEPIQKMTEIVKVLLAARVTVKIFTARAARPQVYR